MAAGNTVTLVGNVTRDPEVRHTNSGATVAQFGLAVNRRYQKDNEWVEDTSFFDVTSWTDLATNVAESVTKGMRVVVFGRLNQQTWETDEGDKRSRVEIVADDVAPSLRWATAAVTKNPKKDGGNSGGGSAPVPDYPGGDEEPF
jgi:single-strand DNA-binding protein